MAATYDGKPCRTCGGTRRFQSNRHCTQCSGTGARRLNRTLQAQYGITLAEYERLYVAQGGTCAICLEPCPTGKRLAVDHDHELDRVRGLLCVNCNRGIGHLHDSIDLLTRAVFYLTAARAAITARLENDE